MGNWGGKRPNAGRKPGQITLARQAELKARERLITKVVKHWDNLIDLKLRMALGSYYIEEILNERGKKQKRHVYKAVPDSKSATELMEFVIGKPRQATDVSLDGEVTMPGIDMVAQGIKAILEGKAKKPSNVKKTDIAAVAPVIPKPVEVKPVIPVTPVEKPKAPAQPLFNYPPKPVAQVPVNPQVINNPVVSLVAPPSPTFQSNPQIQSTNATPLPVSPHDILSGVKPQ